MLLKVGDTNFDLMLQTAQSFSNPPLSLQAHHTTPKSQHGEFNQSINQLINWYGRHPNCLVVLANCIGKTAKQGTGHIFIHDRVLSIQSIQSILYNTFSVSMAHD